MDNILLKYLVNQIRKQKDDTRFALPVYDENGEVERYNVFSARLLIRHASSGKMYLYDVLEIKKETSKSCQE